MTLKATTDTSSFAQKAFCWFRIILAWLWFLIACIICCLLLPFRWKDTNLDYVFAKLVERVSLPLLGLKPHVENRIGLYVHQPCIFIGNHQSNLDILTFCPIYAPGTVVIGKKELRWVPFFGLFFFGAGNILINRQNRTKAVAGLDEACKRIRNEGLSVWIFPEGTRNRGSKDLLPFKKGAFHLAVATQLPIVPVVHMHLDRYFHRETMCVKKGNYNIRVLPAIPTAGCTVEDIPDLMRIAREKIEQALRTPELGPTPG
ncbi:MAG: lysophospholipid acyltransferase family protein [Bacteriovoracia bacterium]